MSNLTYTILHVFGMSLAFLAIGALAARALDGGGGERSRKLATASHGIGLLVILISGFGLLAKLQIGFPAWVWVKILIWLIVGALPVLIRRMPQRAAVLWFLVPVLVLIAGSLALYKPF